MPHIGIHLLIAAQLRALAGVYFEAVSMSKQKLNAENPSSVPASAPPISASSDPRRGQVEGGVSPVPTVPAR